MTSTTYSEKTMSEFKQGRALYLWTLRKNLKLTVAYIILLFASLPVIQIIFFNRTYLWDSSPAEEVGIIEFMRTVYPSVFSFFAVVFTLIVGLVTFSNMHNKRTVDLFAALPMRKTTQFFARFLSAFTLAWVPMLAVTAMSSFFCMLLTRPALDYIFHGFLWLTLSMIANLSMVAFLSVCAGSVTDVIVSYLAIGAAWPAIVFVFYWLPGVVVPGYGNSLYNLNPIILLALSPFALSFVGFYYYMNVPKGLGYTYNDGTSLFLLWWIIFIAAALIASVLLLKRRKNECAQSDFAFSAPQIVIRTLSNFISGVGIGMLFAVFAESAGNLAQLIWFCIGAVLGSFAAHIIFQLMYQHRFKGFARSLIYYGVSLVTAIAFAVCLATGWFGTDTYVPRAQDVNRATVQLEIYTYNEALGRYTAFYTEPLDFTKYDDPEQIEQVLKIHEKFADSLDYFYPKPYSLAGNVTNYYRYIDIYEYNGSDKIYANLDLGYTTKADKCVYRDYNGDVGINDEITAALEEFIDSTDIIRRSINLYKLLGAPYYNSKTPLRIDNIDVTPDIAYWDLEAWEKAFGGLYGEQKAFNYYGTEVNEIAEALRKDLDAKDDLLKYIATEYSGDTESIRVDIEYWVNIDGYASDSFYIDKTFTNTIEVLKANGADIDALFG